MTPSDILAFSDPRAADVALTGGKGASLARNKALGLPVPDGFVVTAAAFRAFAAGSLDLTGLAADAAPETIETWAQSRREALSANSLPQALRAEITGRLEAWPQPRPTGLAPLIADDGHGMLCTFVRCGSAPTDIAVYRDADLLPVHTAAIDADDCQSRVVGKIDFLSHRGRENDLLAIR